MKNLTYPEIKEDIKKAREELYIATRNFDYADSKDLIDICTLQIALARKKCDYLTKIAKEQGIVCEDLAESCIL